MMESGSEISDGEYELPTGFDFEFVDTTTKETSDKISPKIIQAEEINSKDGGKRLEEADLNPQNHKEATPQKPADDETGEFLFPLFAGANKGTADANSLMKVSIKNNAEYETVAQSRPDSYYFAEYTDDDKRKIKQSAIEYVDIFNSFDNRFKNKKCLDATQYNLSLQKDNKRKRRSLKNRINKIQAQKNIKERINKAKSIHKQQTKFVNQKKKRGGKKNKKKPVSTTKRFKTE